MPATMRVIVKSISSIVIELVNKSESTAPQKFLPLTLEKNKPG